MKYLYKFLKFTLIAFIMFLVQTSYAAAETHITQNITTDTTWSLAQSPIIIDSEVSVEAGATLTVSSGVVVRFGNNEYGSNYNLNVFGKIVSGSLGGERTVFTSIDDPLDSVNSCSWNAQLYFGWKIIVYRGASAIFNDTLLQCGDSVYVEGGTVDATRVISSGMNVGLIINWYSPSSVANYRESEFRDTRGSGVMCESGNVNISNTIFINNYFGIESDAPCKVSIKDNYFSGTNAPILTMFGNPNEPSVDYTPYTLYDNNIMENNAINNIVIGGGYGTIKDIGVPYVAYGIGLMDMIFDKGIKIKVIGSDSQIYQSLQIRGTKEEPVIITSFSDDSIGGDSNCDGSTIPSPGSWKGFWVMPGAKLTASNAEIRYSGALGYYTDSDWSYIPNESSGSIHVNDGTAQLDNVTIKDSLGVGILMKGGTLNADHVRFLSIAKDVDALPYAVKNNSPQSSTASILNSWWGSEKGPLSDGLGLSASQAESMGYKYRVTDGVLTSPFLHSDSNGGISNIMFLPGIMGSDLYRSNGDNCWAGLTWGDEYNCMEMENTTTPKTQGVVTRDTLGAVYGGLKDKLKEWQTKYGIVATSTPYDWRYGIEHIVNSGYDTGNGVDYTGEISNPYLVKKFRELTASSPTGKVTIMAHSMGGLVTKALTKKLEELGLGDKVDQVIFIATPQLGTPKAAASLLHGTEGAIKLGLVISDKQVRGLAQNMQSAISLLPSDGYFYSVDDPVITLSTTSPAYSSLVQAFGEKIHDVNKMNSFLANEKWGKPEYSDLATPSVLNIDYLNTARDLHIKYDNWTPPQGVKLTTIAGSGLDTISGIQYYGTEIKNGKEVPKYTVSHVQNGDGTVVTPSAQYRNGIMGDKYYIDLNRYNKSGIIGETVDREHSDITEVPELQTLLERLSTASSTQGDYEYIKNAEPATNNRLHFVLHSPLTLGFKDLQGNYTGLTASGTIENNIPGAQYERYGEIQWMSLPNDINGELVMQGTDNGTFDLEVRNELNGVILQNTTFVDIPVLTTTEVTMNIDSSDITKAGDMIVDVKGDNTEVISLTPKVGEEVTIKKLVTITPKNIDLILHSDTPALDYVIQGDSTNTTEIIGDPICTTSATNQSSIGKYDIACTEGTLKSDKYDFQFATGTISISYKFSGLLEPVNELGVYKQGRTIPIKFKLFDINNVSQQSNQEIHWNTPIRDNMLSNQIISDINTTATSTDDIFKFDNTDKQYIYNWNTKSTQAGYWYKLPISIPDGKSYQTVIGLK